MFAVWGLIVLAGIFVVIRFTGLIDHMLPAGDPPNFTFAPETPVPQARNFFIVCPPGRSPRTDRAMPSPSFDATAATLADVMIETAPAHGMQLMSGVPGGKPGRLYFLARTPVFHFPDWVEVEFILPEQGGDITFCLFAQSVYGLDDIQQNEKRTRAWLADIVGRMGPSG
ncbi:DUF1499 domain-containing protein [uncultured Thalassospira sp.]|uniref:DUF1499 domain-containing protein n=1 Tax=Thalassospira povalilytica TaxID=732237 RepID=UPI00258A13BC|nr:DUF1499 domain-containing protein [uncultured Thalassospira sp.]